MLPQTSPVLPIFSVLFAFLAVTSSVVGEGEEDATKTVSGIVGGDVDIPCDIKRLSRPPQVAWKDTVYSTVRDQPAVIYDNGQANDEHIDAARFSVSQVFTLTITELNPGDIGDYFCESTLSDGTILTSKYSLVLMGEPECEGETQLTEGDIIQLTCNVEFTGSGGDIAWYVGDERLDSEDHNELSILNIVFKETATGKYDNKDLVCRLTVGTTIAECTKSMDIQYSPKVQFEDTTGAQESSVTLTCNAPSNPTPKIALFKENKDGSEEELKSGAGMTVTVDEEAGMASVEISSLDRNHAGYYRCDATNTLGDNTGKAMLIVTETTTQAPVVTEAATDPTTVTGHSSKDKPTAPPKPDPTEPPKGSKEPVVDGGPPGGDASLLRHSLLVILSSYLLAMYVL